MKKTNEVYKVVNIINGKIYVGITNQGYKIRWYKHCSDAIHDSSFPIHQAIRKYGVANFTVEVLEVCENIDLLKEREQYWIKELNSRTINGEGYNLTDGGDGTFGRKHSKETKEKIRASMMGKNVGPKPPGFGAKVSERMKGRKTSAETRAKLSKALKGKPKSKEWHESIQETWAKKSK